MGVFGQKMRLGRVRGGRSERTERYFSNPIVALERAGKRVQENVVQRDVDLCLEVEKLV